MESWACFLQSRNASDCTAGRQPCLDLTNELDQEVGRSASTVRSPSDLQKEAAFIASKAMGPSTSVLLAESLTGYEGTRCGSVTIVLMVALGQYTLRY